MGLSCSYFLVDQRDFFHSQNYLFTESLKYSFVLEYFKKLIIFSMKWGIKIHLKNEIIAGGWIRKV